MGTLAADNAPMESKWMIMFYPKWVFLSQEAINNSKYEIKYRKMWERFNIGQTTLAIKNVGIGVMEKLKNTH